MLFINRSVSSKRALLELRNALAIFEGVDSIIIVAAMLLVGIGLATLWSLSHAAGGTDVNFRTQLIACALGLVGAIVCALIDYRLWVTWRRTLYMVMLMLLGAVLIIGSSIRGTKGWFVFGPLSLQPVEIVKVLLLVVLAATFARWASVKHPSKHLIWSFGIILPIIALVAFQPDLGSVVMLLVLWASVLLIWGLSTKWWFALGVVAGISAIGLWFVLAPYQQARIKNFFNPAADPQGSGYNVIQSRIAIGSGGLYGRGFGGGSQGQLRFLPEGQTDFIFAVLAEEFGLVGVVVIIGLYATLYGRLLWRSLRINDDFSALLLGGAAIMLGLQTTLIIGMNMGLLPVTGLPLPLMSAGGSSLVATLVLLGLCESVIIHTKQR